MNSIAAIEQAVRKGIPYGVALGDFLDAFYRQPTADKLREEPCRLANFHTNGAIYDALLAATVEHLARLFEMPIPRWCMMEERRLEKPFFAMPSPSFRATLLLESPPAFRSRNLFVTANALERASQHATPSR